MFLKADNADADQTTQMHMLILVVIGRTYPKVCFFMLRRTFIILRTNSADDRLMIIFLYSTGSLTFHAKKKKKKCQNPLSRENKKKIFQTVVC